MVDISILKDTFNDTYNHYQYITKERNNLQEKIFRLVDCPYAIARGDGTFFAFKKAYFLDGKNNVSLITASPVPAYLKIMFPELRFVVRKTPLYANEGEMTTHTGLSGARNQLKERIEYVKQLMDEGKIENDSYIIGFKDEEKAWTDAGLKLPYFNGKLIHMGNCAGLDFLKGAHIVIAGKFDYNPQVYTDLHAWLHPDCHEKPNGSNRYVQTSHGTQKIWTYNDPLISQYQLETINYFVSQAAGRARVLREVSAKVHIIGNYPIEDCDIFDDTPYNGKEQKQ